VNDIKKRSEHVEQREFVSWVRKNHPKIKIFAIPNGGLRGIASAARLKAEGVSAGVPDLFIPSLKMFIEMKIAGGKVSDSQCEWLDYLVGAGYTCCVCYGKEEAEAVFVNMLLYGPERSRN
jgi:hypothetical protein